MASSPPFFEALVSKPVAAPLPPMPALPITSARTILNMKTLPVAAGDIFICSYPKSGTTWTQNIVYQLVTRGAPLVTEILDARTQNILRRNVVLRASSEFCMSNKFVAQVGERGHPSALGTFRPPPSRPDERFRRAQILAMVAENRRVKRLLDELLDGVAGGAALHMRKAQWLACEGEAVSFAALQVPGGGGARAHAPAPPPRG